MLKKLLTGTAAVIFAAGLAGAANLSIMSGPQDPSQLLATVNTLIQSINTGVSGRLSANLTATSPSAASTADLTMQQYILPASRLAADGDSVRVVCWGSTANNGNLKTIKLFFGTSSISTATMGTQPTNKKWQIELIVMRSGAATQVISGRGAFDLSPHVIATADGTDSLTAAVTIKCTGAAVTTASDIVANGMLVEQIK